MDFFSQKTSYIPGSYSVYLGIKGVSVLSKQLVYTGSNLRCYLTSIEGADFFLDSTFGQETTSEEKKLCFVWNVYKNIIKMDEIGALRIANRPVSGFCMTVKTAQSRHAYDKNFERFIDFMSRFTLLRKLLMHDTCLKDENSPWWLNGKLWNSNYCTITWP